MKFKILITFLAAFSIAFAFQNCGGFSTNSLGNGLFSSEGETPSDPLLRSVYEASNDVVSTAQDPARSLDFIFSDRGVCSLRGGAGLYLAPLAFTTQLECQNRCSALTANPNRTCTWRDSNFFGDPALECSVRGGAGALLSQIVAATRSQCQTECDRFSANTFRRCDFGTERLLHPPVGSECRVFGGAGLNLLPSEIVFASASECQNLCDQQTGAYRTCMIGNRILRAPPESSRCEIWGGAGLVLAPVFSGTLADCQSKCDSFTQNPNRICLYGRVKLK